MYSMYSGTAGKAELQENSRRSVWLTRGPVLLWHELLHAGLHTCTLLATLQRAPGEKRERQREG